MNSLIYNIIIILIVIYINSHRQNLHNELASQTQLDESYDFIIDRQNLHNKLASRTQWDQSYDFIIIGSGSAGSVVASRLSEISNVKVLLLEAGGHQTVISDMPAKLSSLWNSEIDWKYKSVPQKNAGFAYVNSEIPILRGKVLGGSSTINVMIYNRGNKLDYNNWARTYGAKGWTYDEVLPYFLKSENNTDAQIVLKNSKYHFTNGLLTISTPNENDNTILQYLNITNQFGYPFVDVNGPQQYGVTMAQMTVKNGVRQSTATAFLEPENIRKRHNLHIVANAFVTKIHFKKIENMYNATGVSFTKNGINYNITASKDVILSAGAINSPQILMLSGIGPKNHLKMFNISLIADLPVGDNLQDHPCVLTNFDINNQSSVESNAFTRDNLYNYFVNHNGPLSLFTATLLYVRTYNQMNDLWPGGFTAAAKLLLISNLEQSVSQYENKSVWSEYFKPYLGRAQFNHASVISRPYSRGTVRLNSTNPFDYPLIDPKYLNNENDIKLLIDIMRKSLTILLSSEFKKIAKIYSPIPGCNPCRNNDILCDSYLECVVRMTLTNLFHQCCTCRMGSAHDNNAVTDERLRVRKVGSLRVIDASVMPLITSGNTNAPTIMIAEKGADMIKEDYQLI